MRQHVQQAATAALHSERLSRIQDTLESGNSRLLGHVTALARRELEPSSLRPDVGQHNTPKRPPRKGLKREKVYEVRLSLPRWFSQSVWDLGMYASEGIWAICLQQRNMRPWDTYIFEVVRSGDIESVSHLLRSGHLSFQDCAGKAGLLEVSSDRLHEWLCSIAHPLQIAASYGHVELCRFLLDSTSLFDDSSVLRSAFEAYLYPYFPFHFFSSLPGQQGSSQVIEALYHLFAKEHGMDVEHSVDPNFEDNLWLNRLNLYAESHALTSDCLSLTKNALQDVLALQPLPFASLPFSKRFYIAMYSRGWPAESFMELLTSEDPTEIVTSANRFGKQAIHWAAAHFGESASYSMRGNALVPCKETDSYAELASRLLVGGADVHALVIDGPPRDPFLCFLDGTWNRIDRMRTPEQKQRGWDHRSLSMAVQSWGAMLVSAGQSLSMYAEVVSRFLSTSQFSLGNSSSQWALRPTRLDVIEGSGLSMYATTSVKVTQWSQEQTHVPGSWPKLYNPVPNTIFWEPQEEDECEGFHWRKLKTLTMESKPFLVEPASSDSLTKALMEAHTELITGTQDDHGPIACMVIREMNFRRQRTRIPGGRRAASMPPSRTTWGYPA